MNTSRTIRLSAAALVLAAAWAATTPFSGATFTSSTSSGISTVTADEVVIPQLSCTTETDGTAQSNSSDAVLSWQSEDAVSFRMHVANGTDPATTFDPPTEGTMTLAGDGDSSLDTVFETGDGRAEFTVVGVDESGWTSKPSEPIWVQKTSHGYECA
ncbi:hypothetical protein [Citricoccus sp. GCM10030269]|uniref:hypothetical protein n=1 Tax=Citricoccus sp. GCM10030269 TaxID=3273388 RepID=UPI00361035E7